MKKKSIDTFGVGTSLEPWDFWNNTELKLGLESWKTTKLVNAANTA